MRKPTEELFGQSKTAEHKTSSEFKWAIWCENILSVDRGKGLEMTADYTGIYQGEVKTDKYEGWNFNNGNYLFTTDTK